MSAIADRYATISAAFTDRVRGVQDWTAASPCEGWSARDVVAHVVGVHRGLLAGPDGPTEPGADEDVVAAWTAATDGLRSALLDPERAGATLPSPFGPMPMEQLVGRLICTDTLVHTWDLARATGQDEQLDADAVAGAYEGLKPLDAMIRNPGFFAAKIETPPGADLQTEFLGFLGRAV